MKNLCPLFSSTLSFCNSINISFSSNIHFEDRDWSQEFVIFWGQKVACFLVGGVPSVSNDFVQLYGSIIDLQKTAHNVSILMSLDRHSCYHYYDVALNLSVTSNISLVFLCVRACFVVRTLHMRSILLTHWVDLKVCSDLNLNILKGAMPYCWASQVTEW